MKFMYGMKRNDRGGQDLEGLLTLRTARDVDAGISQTHSIAINLKSINKRHLYIIHKNSE